MGKRYDDKRKALRKGESQRKDGIYMYRWTDSNKNRHTLYANSLTELREQEEKVETEKVFKVSRTAETLNDRITIYLGVRANLANATLENYKYYFNHSIKESMLGQMKVSNIKKSDILAFYRQLFSENGYSAGTIKILHKIIRPALQLACDDGLIIKNPADGCTKEYEEDIEKKYALTFSEEEEFLERILISPRIKRYYTMYVIMLKTGLRISEVIGLTWNDVDMDKKEIHVNHQVQYRYVKGKVQYYANNTKTGAGNRIIPMFGEVYRLFVEQRKIWMTTKKDPDFEVNGYKDFVFLSHVTGKCMSHNSIRRMMRRIVDMNDEREVQLPNISPHILRHTACSRLAESGCDIKVLQYIMGHTDLKTTMRAYNHVDKERLKREFIRLEAQKFTTPIFTPNSQKVM